MDYRDIDIVHPIDLDLIEAFEGASITVAFSVRELCPTCSKSGMTCSQCSGSGFIEKVHQLNVSVPAGVDTGQQIRFSGRGHASEDGTQRGHVYLLMTITKHPHFERENHDLRTSHPVEPQLLARGGSISIRGLDRMVRVEIPAHSSYGDRVRVPGRGMPHIRARERGDLIVSLDPVAHAGAMVEEQERVTLYCPRCTAVQEVAVHVVDYRCRGCRAQVLLRRCQSCRSPVQAVLETRRGTWHCPYCEATNQGGRSDQRYAVAETVSRELKDRGSPRLDESWRFLSGLRLIEGYAQPILSGTPCSLTADRAGVTVRAENGSRLAVGFAHADVVSFEVGGPGLVRTGGGFWGGGTGAEGIMEGIVIAEILNALTTRTAITTIVRLTTRTGYFVFQHRGQTPDQVRELFGPLSFFLKQSQHPGTRVQSEPHSSLVEQLQRLAELHRTGELTDDEYAMAKSVLLR